MRLLLLSNSVAPGRGFLEHALESISDVIQSGQRLLFFAYASFDPDRYTEVMRTALRPLDIEVVPAHEQEDLGCELDRAHAVFVGGGNAFRLLKTFQHFGLDRLVRERVFAGLPYLGASAGANLACPTIRTTNDMPIVEPHSLAALGLVPFQINPHYADVDPCSTHMGETREERITQFMEENDVPVLGLREGSWLRVIGETAATGGTRSARLFTRGSPPREMAPGEDVSALLTITPCFDQAEPSGRQA